MFVKGGVEALTFCAFCWMSKRFVGGKLSLHVHTPSCLGLKRAHKASRVWAPFLTHTHNRTTSTPLFLWSNEIPRFFGTEQNAENAPRAPTRFLSRSQGHRWPGALVAGQHSRQRADRPMFQGLWRRNPHVAIVQNRFIPCWDRCTTVPPILGPILVGEWDVHWQYRGLTHGHVAT